ncbi:MAG: HipA domain-containing protein [Bacteroides sp.]|nr:HipA domain-containing protein [Bacteroides sp.]
MPYFTLDISKGVSYFCKKFTIIDHEAQRHHEATARNAFADSAGFFRTSDRHGRQRIHRCRQHKKANGDAHLKNFSLILNGSDYRLAPAYDLLNTGLHVNGGDFGLDGGLSPALEKSDVLMRTGHPCRLDFERFGKQIGLVEKRIDRILDAYMSLPEKAGRLIENSFLNQKMKRNYLRIVNERISRFIRLSEA